MSTKPKVFIGCAREDSAIMNALAAGLEPVASVYRWTDTRMFPPGEFILARLLTHARKFDFAVMLFEPDDTVISRGEETLAPRDNVVFELGLFMGNLENERALAVVPRIDKKLRILSDLGGLIPVSYTPPPKGKKDDPVAVSEALKDAIGEISDRIREKGLWESKDCGAYRGPTDVLDIADALRAELLKASRDSQSIRVCNIALDMEVTWGVIRDRILMPNKVQNVEWRSVMLNPQSEAIKAVEHDTVSTTVAAQRVDSIKKTLAGMTADLAARNVSFGCRLYSAVPALHGFLINESVLLLTLIRIENGKLLGAPNAYWKFVRMSHLEANEHFFRAFEDWFNYHWTSGAAVWPIEKEN